jgi:hypothetical protein
VGHFYIAASAHKSTFTYAIKYNPKNKIIHKITPTGPRNGTRTIPAIPAPSTPLNACTGLIINMMTRAISPNNKRKPHSQSPSQLMFLFKPPDASGVSSKSIAPLGAIEQG